MRIGTLAFVLGASLALSAASVAGALMVRAEILGCEQAYVAFSAWAAQNGAAPPSGAMPTCTSMVSMYPPLLVAFLLGSLGASAATLTMWVSKTSRPAAGL